MKGSTTILRVDGGITTTLFTDRAPDLSHLQRAVGGNIETVPGFTEYNKKMCIAFCDEEGKLKGKSKNAHATTLWWLQYSARGDVLCGDVVVVQGDAEFMEAL